MREGERSHMGVRTIRRRCGALLAVIVALAATFTAGEARSAGAKDPHPQPLPYEERGECAFSSLLVGEGLGVGVLRARRSCLASCEGGCQRDYHGEQSAATAANRANSHMASLALPHVSFLRNSSVLRVRMPRQK